MILLLKNGQNLEQAGRNTIGRNNTHQQRQRVGNKYVDAGASQVVLVVKNPPARAGDIRDIRGLIFDSGRSPGGGHGNPLQ